MTNVTVFGASGFIGRHLVQRLARRGIRVKAAERRPQRARFLMPMGDVGQVVPIGADITDDASVASAVAGADAVVNLVGILHEGGGNGRFKAVHVESAERVARAAKQVGAQRLVHMSALGADRNSRSNYARTKGEGEEVVRAAFPGATIIRPSVVFGPEDDFFNRFAALARCAPALPLFGGGVTRYQPVYVGDVADAMVKCLSDPATAGQIYELTGPRSYSFEEIMRLILAETGRKRPLVKLPFWMADIIGTFAGLAPGKPMLTRDQARLLRQDNVAHSMPGLAALGIEPTACEVILPTYLDRYRRGGKREQD
jgi:NADH dehydrogenase